MGVWKPVAALAVLGLAAAGIGAAGFAQAQGPSAHPGKAVYDAACASCHDDAPEGDRTPSTEALRRMSAGQIRSALVSGPMKPMGDALKPEQRDAVVAYLARPEANVGTAWIDDHRCGPDRAAIDLSGKPAQVGFGVNTNNDRRMTAAQAGLKTAQMADMEVAWSFAFPKTSGLRGQGVVVGSTVFYPAGQAGYLLALDTQTGCVKWAVQPPSPIRASLTFGKLGPKGPLGLVGGDASGNLTAFDARTGNVVWRADPRHDKLVPISGTPLFAGDKILVPISAVDVGMAARPGYACCKTHGALAAVNAADGKLLWTWHTMEDAKPLGRKNSAGVEMYGPSGAPIWSSPAVDLRAGVAYTSTGESTSPPDSGTTDSLVAVDFATGRQKWVFQALANDIWHMACPVGPPAPGAKLNPNCFFANEGSVLRDHDFGGGPVIWKGKGRSLILGGQKSGEVWAVEAATGKKVWRHQFGKGTPLGGVHWGIATDGVRVFAPIADPNVPAAANAAGMYAIDIASGKLTWSWKAAPDCGNGRQARVRTCANRFGLSAAPLVVDGALVAGGLDGRVYAWEAATGRLMWQTDTAVRFEALNKLPANGGTIDAAGPFAGDGLLFVSSGYASFGQQGGNVLVAYRPKK